jgi:hypothetical protein
MSEQFDKRKRKNREKHDKGFDTMMKKAGFEKTGSGKGDNQRPTDKDEYDRNYERIFGHK